MRYKGDNTEQFWRCDGSNFPGNCLKGNIDYEQTRGWKRWRCVFCDFDLCEECVSVYGANVSPNCFFICI